MLVWPGNARARANCGPGFLENPFCEKKQPEITWVWVVKATQPANRNPFIWVRVGNKKRHSSQAGRTPFVPRPIAMPLPGHAAFLMNAQEKPTVWLAGTTGQRTHRARHLLASSRSAAAAAALRWFLLGRHHDRAPARLRGLLRLLRLLGPERSALRDVLHGGNRAKKQRKMSAGGEGRTTSF